MLPLLAADNVKPLVIVKKSTPTSDFLFLAVCEPTDNDDSDSEDDVESPKSPAQSRAASAARERDA